MERGGEEVRKSSKLPDVIYEQPINVDLIYFYHQLMAKKETCLPMTVIFADFCLVSKIPSVDTSHVYNPVMSMCRFFKTTVLSSERETWEQITLNF